MRPDLTFVKYIIPPCPQCGSAHWGPVACRFSGIQHHKAPTLPAGILEYLAECEADQAPELAERPTMDQETYRKEFE